MHDYVYKDRKMMKWIPFNALLEQGDYIYDLLQGKTRKEMPTLSSDQYLDMNYNVQTALSFKKEVSVLYFQDHDYKEIHGYIQKIDLYQKQIHIGSQILDMATVIQVDIL